MTDVSARRVTGKKALITGAARGLGAATARMLARHGARVFLTDLEKMWALMLPGFVRPDRVDYFRQFIKRRTKIAIGSTSALAGSN